MNATDRRTLIKLALAAAIAPAVLPIAALAMPDRLIAPPARPMRYSRTVVREMADGAEFAVTRHFRVDFHRFTDGFMLYGEQESASVQAPAALARFAALEEGRDESAIFPITLDPFGQIRTVEVRPLAPEDVRRAVEEALSSLGQQSLDRDERLQLANYISALQQASQRVTARLPTDLFAPAPTPRTDEQRIALPDGTEGLVASRFGGVRDEATGLMRSAEREILTVVAGSSRRLREQWTLVEIEA